MASRVLIGRPPDLLIPILGLCALSFPACVDQRPSPHNQSSERAVGPRTVAPVVRPVLTADQVLETTRSAVVWIESLDRKGRVVAQGSGVIVSSGAIVTVWSRVSGASSVRIRHQGAVRPAAIDAMLEGPGLARLAAEVTGAVGMGRDPYPSPGAVVYGIAPSADAPPTLSERVVTGIGPLPARAGDAIETTVKAAEGEVGGALIDSYGELVGIIASTGPRDQASRAVPVRYVKDLLALPSGTLPRATRSPLLRLADRDRKWLRTLMNEVARDQRPLTALELDRAKALLDQIEPLVGAELAWAKVELGFGWLSYQRALWEDAVEAFTFRRVMKGDRRAALEKNLLSLGVVDPGDIAAGDRIIAAVAAHEEFDMPGARIEANERWLTQRLSQIDRERARLASELWAAR